MKLGEDAINYASGTKDAVHVPVVVAYVNGSPLKPGDSVRFTDNGFCEVIASNVEDRHGIVDPFAPESEYGDNDLVFVLVKPGLTQNLRHEYDIITDEGYYDSDCVNCN